jgi:RND family efflux transporter MFP subunit
MKNMKDKIKIFALLLIPSVILFSCDGKKDQQKLTDNVINVTVATPSAPGGKGFFNASGQIEASQFANISTRTMGYVTQIHVKVGDKVKKGQALIHINNEDMEARRAQANAALNQAMARFSISKKNFERFKTLHEQNSASQKEFDDMKMQYEIAEAQVESARQVQNEIDAMLMYSNIKAPFNGVITSKTVNVGDLANPGQVLMSLETPGRYLATAMVPESQIALVKQKDTVKVYVKSNDLAMTGIVSEVSTSSQFSGGQYLVKIKLVDTPKIPLYTGMFVSTAFLGGDPTKSQILIPSEVLVKKGGLVGIYTVSSSNTAILRWLKLGRTMGDQIEVLSGLTADEQYIISADGKLYNGVKINIK